MTANPFAALLDGVCRYSYHDYDDDDGYCFREKDVLAALAAAYPADLAEVGKRAAYIANECQQAADVMADTGTFPTGQAIFRDASAQITALLARIAAQEAQIGEQGRLVRDLTKRARGAEEQRDQNRDTAIEFETALAAERAKTAKLVEAGREMDAALSAEDEEGDFLIEAHGSQAVLKRYVAAKKRLRAAITEASQ